MNGDIKRMRREASFSSTGAEAYLEYLKSLLKKARVKPVLSSQGYETVIYLDIDLLAEIAYLKEEDGMDIDDPGGLPEYEKEFQKVELEALRIPN